MFEVKIDAALSAWLAEHIIGSPVSVEPVQSLWSGYGEIVRIRLQGGDVPSVIVKWVEPPREISHPRGWSGQASHQRKLRSYEVEQCFYSDWLLDPVQSHRTARCYAAEPIPGGWRFLLEDLNASGYALRHERLRSASFDRCLAWLASFHAHFLGRSPRGLWETGTYWHLATRADEFEVLEDPELREAAPLLDAVLSGAEFQTLVHGDAKVENFCFGESDVAAVDFQYVGGGCGIKDVVYFLSSCLSDAQCESKAPKHLDTYFRFLRENLAANVDAEALEEEWRSLYPAAWADFYRFLAGWAPGHWKIHRYTRSMTQEALALL